MKKIKLFLGSIICLFKGHNFLPTYMKYQGKRYFLNCYYCSRCDKRKLS